MSRWFRLDDDVINDPKILLLPEAMRWVWIAFLCIASKNNGALPSIEIVALSLRVKTTKAAEYITRLVSAGLIDKTETGFAPHNWNARQYKSDEPRPAKGKDSYVYIIGKAWGADALKIGFSKNPWARIVELQTAHHEKLSVLAVFKCQSHSEVDVHDLLKPYRKSGEWFSLPAKIYVAISNAADRSVHYDDLVVQLRTLLRSATTEADTEPQSEKRDSEAEASGADAPIDHRKRLFNEGLQKLATMTGKGPDACRSFVGKCLKASSDDAVVVLGLIEDAERNQVVDPGAWISARLKPKETGNGRRTVHDASKDLLAKIRSFDAEPPSGICDGTGGPPLRLLSSG